MRVEVAGLDAYFHRSAAHLIQQFDDEAEIVFDESEANESSDLVRISVEMRPAEDHIEIAVRVEGQRMTVMKTELYRPAAGASIDLGSVKDKAMKHAVNRPLLKALEEYTGISQPWGVLTGVRPTKLMHQQAKDSKPPEEARRTIEQQYLVKPHKIDMMSRIVQTQLNAIPDLYRLGNEVSLYIGIPYCPTKCAYCTFPAYAIKASRQGDVDTFLFGLHYEMQQTGKWLKERGIDVTTIYFGGGTPTSITAEEMDRLYHVMNESIPMERVREITVEAGRPDTITKEKLEVLKKWGIDRISINPQTYTQETLKAIGRHHTVEETIEKFWLARQMGMNNINMDLIIGLPGEGVKQFSHTLEQTSKLMPESLTVHTLSFKRASEMTQNKQKYPVAGREEILSMMKMAEEWTAHHRYEPYYLYRQKNILGNLENVGYAQAGKESLYNIMIMEEMQTIIGIGCGAASKLVDPETGKIERLANPKEPKAYNERFQEYTVKKLDALDKWFSRVSNL